VGAIRRRTLVTWGGRLRYLFRALFDVDDAAPIAVPYVDNTGYSFDTYDTGNKAAVSGGWLGWGSSTANNNPYVVGQTNLYPQLVLPGGAVAWRFRSGGGGCFVGLTNNKTASAGALLYPFFSVVAGGISVSGRQYSQPFAYATDNTPYWLAMVFRTTGAHWFIKGGAFADWTLMFTITGQTTLAGSTAWYPFMAARSTTSDFDFDTIVAANLSGPFATDTGLATSYAASTAAGDTATMTANGVIAWEITAATGQVYELSVRRTDDNNRVVIRANQAGSPLKIIKVEGGSESELATVAATLTNGTAYRITAICNGNSLVAQAASGAEWSTTAGCTGSSAFNAAATGVKVSHNGGALGCWPQNHAGASAQLDRLIA